VSGVFGSSIHGPGRPATGEAVSGRENPQVIPTMRELDRGWMCGRCFCFRPSPPPARAPLSTPASGLGARTSTNLFAHPRLFFLFADQAHNHRILLSTPTAPHPPLIGRWACTISPSCLPCRHRGSSCRTLRGVPETQDRDRKQESRPARRHVGRGGVVRLEIFRSAIGSPHCAGCWRARVGAFLFAPSGPKYHSLVSPSRPSHSTPSLFPLLLPCRAAPRPVNQPPPPAPPLPRLASPRLTPPSLPATFDPASRSAPPAQDGRH